MSGRDSLSQCVVQCKTWARGLSEQWCYDVIMLSQPGYDLSEKMAHVNIKKQAN